MPGEPPEQDPPRQVRSEQPLEILVGEMGSTRFRAQEISEVAVDLVLSRFGFRVLLAEDAERPAAVREDLRKAELQPQADVFAFARADHEAARSRPGVAPHRQRRGVDDPAALPKMPERPVEQPEMAIAEPRRPRRDRAAGASSGEADRQYAGIRERGREPLYFLQIAGQPFVVGVEERDVMRPCKLRAAIARGRNAGIFLRDDPEADGRVGGRKYRLGNRGGPVDRPVVDDDDFVGPPRLAKDRPECLADRSLLVEQGNDDGDAEGRRHSSIERRHG